MTKTLTGFVALMTLGCGGDGPSINPDAGDAGDAGRDDSATVDAPTGDGGNDGFNLLSIADVDDGAKPELWIDRNGDVNVAYIFEDNSGWVRHARFGTAEPTITTAAEGYFYGPIDGASFGDGSAAIVYHDHDLADQVLAMETDAGWSLQPMTNASHDGWYNAILVDGSDVVHTATYDPRGAPAGLALGVHYGRYDGEWTIELAASGSFDYAGGMTVALATDGTVYIAFFDDVARNVLLLRRNGEDDWDDMVVEEPGDNLEAGRFPQLMIGDNDVLHLVYLVRTEESAGVIRYATGSFDDLSLSDVARIDDLMIGFTGARNVASIALTEANSPVVTIQSRSSTRLAVRDGDGFRVAEIAAGSFGQHCSTAVEGNTAHIAWWEPGGASQGTVRYAQVEF